MDVCGYSSMCAPCVSGMGWERLSTTGVSQRKDILEDPRLPEIYRITLAQNLDMELFLKVHKQPEL
jgi:hypothetical protein